jgi:hypothetical protein
MDGAKIKFTSHVIPYMDDGLDGGGSYGVLTLDGQKYLVGKNASDGFAKLNVSPEFHGGPTWKVLLVWAFYQAMKHRTGNELVLDKLGLGLPYSQHRKPLIEKIKSMQEFSFQVDGRDYLVTAKETTVLHRARRSSPTSRIPKRPWAFWISDTTPWTWFFFGISELSATNPVQRMTASICLLRRLVK